jgi:hypothetical protein
MPKCNNNSSTKACSLLAVGDLKNRIVYLRHLQRETNAVKNFLATVRQSTLPTPKLPNELIATSIHKVHQYFGDYGHQLRKALFCDPQVRLTPDYLLRQPGIEIASMTVCQLGSGQFEAVGELVSR